MKRALFVMVLVTAWAAWLGGARVAAADPMYVPPPPHLEAPTDPVRLPTMIMPRAPGPATPPEAPPPEPTDKRPFLIAGGALVLVAVLLWNRDRERKLARDHGPTAPRARRWRVKPDGDADADADALADAADPSPADDPKEDDHD